MVKRHSSEMNLLDLKVTDEISSISKVLGIASTLPGESVSGYEKSRSALIDELDC